MQVTATAAGCPAVCLRKLLLRHLLKDGLLCLLLWLTWGQGHQLVHDWLLKGPPPQLAST
jgi:hypothetical protein